jgi:shikimate kinase
MALISTPTTTDLNLILTGYMSPMQLSIARRAAEKLKMRFVDFNARLEALAGMPSDEIRDVFGDTRVKTLENELIAEMSLYRSTVLLISAETLLRGEALATLSASGVVVCLYASVDAVLQRLHLALGDRFNDPRQRDIELGRVRREWAIRKQEGVLSLDTTAFNDAQSVDRIGALWREIVVSVDWRGA